MSINAFGSNTSTGIPPVPPLPSPGVTNRYTNTVLNSQSGQANPILEAVAGPKCNINWVDSLDDVLAHPTSPNEEMYFQDKNNPVIYRRITDGNGNIKNPVHALHYTVEEVAFGPEAQFVTKEEHKQLYSLVEKLSGNIDSMNGKLEQLLNG